MPRKVKKDLAAKQSPLPKSVKEKTEVVKTVQVLVNKDHVYQVLDQFYPSVTTILSALAKGKGFNTWLQSHTPEESDEILESAGLSGSKIHKAISELLEGKRVIPQEFTYKDDEGIEHTGLTPEESRKLSTFVRWWFEFKPKVLSFEKIVYSESRKYAGTVDFIGAIKVSSLLEQESVKKEEVAQYKPDDWLMFVIDWKTNKSGIYTANKLQAAAYAVAESEMTGKKIDKIGILRIGTKHKCGYEFKVMDIYEPYKAFLGVMEAWKFENPKFGPKLIDLPLYFELPQIEQVEIKTIKKKDNANIRNITNTPIAEVGSNKIGDEKREEPAGSPGLLPLPGRSERNLRREADKAGHPIRA